MISQNIAAQIETESIVSSEQGSWKWQNAYRISTYQAHLTPDGRVLWRSIHRSGKYSFPQLFRSGRWQRSPHHGGLNHKPVSRREAISAVGISRVRALESRGWKFIAE